MNYYPVGLAALIVLAAAAVLYWYHRRNASNRETERIKALQWTLGIKPGVGQGKPAEVQRSTALAVIPNQDVLPVNGAWLQTMNFTTEPDPLFNSRSLVRDAQSRARAIHDKIEVARKQRNWELADQLIQDALHELAVGMRLDHWYAADLCNQHGCVVYEQGRYVEAREIWEKAEMICHEWPDKCRHLLPTVESNIKLVTGMLGF
jgi:tetratricopeptide (TPR) repeat protein